MASGLVRVGPVHFQPLEQELEPVVQYLGGHLLNAGSGSRDISPFLAAHGVTKLTKYDIASSDPEVILGPLEAMPFGDASFDSVLCNAVLEHVAGAEEAIRELARVVRPGGHVVVAVPFLQPFHPCPGDYRRYTADGLAALGRDAGLEVVAMLPVHSIAQTLGWILWEAAQERGGRGRKAAAYLTAYLATRLWNRTDAKLVRNANTFQAVFRRPHRMHGEFSDAWREWPVPVASGSVPTMLITDELRLLNYLADEYYKGEGVIIDAGCFLGGSTVALADGLRRNLRRRGVAETPLIHSYDRFEVEDWTRGRFFPESTPAGASFQAQFRRNVAPYESLVAVHAGDVCQYEWQGRPIEILFIDLAKHWRVCDWVTWQFFRHLIPGRSIVVQQDYLYHQWTAWLHVTMEYYSEYFEYIADTGQNSVAFRYIRKIPDDVLREKTVESLSIEEKTELMDRAALRFRGSQRELLLAAKEQFLQFLRGQDPAVPQSDLPYEPLMKIQEGALAYRHRGVPLLKNPFDLALYPLLLERARPRTIIEIGSHAGGSALWLADQTRTLGLDTRILSIDLAPPADVRDPAVTFLRGDAHALADVLPRELLEGLARPLLVVEDSSHRASTTSAVLDFFDPWMQSGEFIVVEDGILTDMRAAAAYEGGPLRAIHEFLARTSGRYEIDRSLCDYFGRNVTWNVDGYLRRV